MSDKRIVIKGGNLTGANFGIGEVTQITTAGIPVGLDVLRAAVAEHAEAIVARGETPELRAEIQRGVDATRAELAKAQPDGRIVKARWGAVLTLIGGLIAANADAAQIWQFIAEHFG